jgi:hypothetical protein
MDRQMLVQARLRDGGSAEVAVQSQEPIQPERAVQYPTAECSGKWILM